MHDLKQAFQIAKQNFSGWRKNPRIWLTFVLALILCLMLSDQILTQAIRYETIVQMFEPFIWTYGDATSLMLSSLLLILIFADMPFINQATPYWLIRTKRSVWLAGQILYVVITTVIYNLFLLIVLGLMAAPFSYVGNVWSETAAMLGYGGGEQITVPVSIKTMQISTPYSCAVTVFGLMLLYSLFVVTLVLFLNLAVGKMAGVMGAFATMSKKKVGQYSLGMRERLGIAQAIMEDPELLILDEPFNGLDKRGAEEVCMLLKGLKEQGKTILLAAHNMPEIDWLCDTVCEMDAGVLTQVR